MCAEKCLTPYRHFPRKSLGIEIFFLGSWFFGSFVGGSFVAFPFLFLDGRGIHSSCGRHLERGEERGEEGEKRRARRGGVVVEEGGRGPEARKGQTVVEAVRAVLCPAIG